MKQFIKDFKAFAMKGNIVDLAIAVVIGGAFNKVVSSLVKDIIMPIIGVLTGGVNFNYLKITLVHAIGKKPAVTINIGTFIQTVINFLIISLTIFIVIKAFAKLQRKEEKKKIEVPTEEVLLLREIRDSLKKVNTESVDTFNDK